MRIAIKQPTAAYGLSGTAMVVVAAALYYDRINLPTAALGCALVVTVAAAGIGLRFAAGLSLIALALLTALSLAQAQQLVPADTDWLEDGIQLADIAGIVALFIMMAAGSWASGRELRRSLAQTLELQELAELGKLTTNLLHDLVNPITAASLNLEQLHSSGDQLAIDQAMISIRYLERYVIAARNQLQQHRQPQMFEVAAEIDQVMQLLASKAQAQAVRIDLLAPSKVWLYGDQVKFNRLILNLVVNAIEAYATVSDEPISAWIHIRVDALDGKIIIVVADGAAGIAPGAIPKLFEPFFSTKRTGNNGRGIGLSIARQITVDDFGGEITVMSAAGETRFTITVPAPAVDRTSDS